MKIKSTLTLYIIDILTLILILIIHFAQNNVLRIILGLPFVLFIPGYTLITALFPGKSSLEEVQRIALSFGLSLAVVPLIGLILNYTTGITADSILFSFSGFVFSMTVVAWFRLRRLQDSELVVISIPRFSWGTKSRLDKVLTVILALVILGALGTAIYTITTPKIGQQFTEFYILDPEGNATDYVKDIKLGDTDSVTLGIINNEYQQVSYQVEIQIDGVSNKIIGPIILKNDEKYENIVTFEPLKAGDNQEVEFLLFKNEETEPYRQLHIRINVK